MLNNCLIFRWGILLLFLFQNIPLKTSGQHIRQISPEGGFTLAPVVEISQDKLGFIWFITREKLYQYNSVDFISYNPKFPADIHHINNYVNALLIDDQNQIWIGTNAGLNIFNDSTEQLEYVELEDTQFPGRKMNIMDIRQNQDGDIWILDGMNLARIEKSGFHAEFIVENGTRLLINAFCFDGSGNIFAANNQGDFFHIDAETGQIDRFPVTPASTKLHGMYYIDDVIWVTTDGFGFSRYSTSGNHLGTYLARYDGSDSNWTPRIREVVKTSDGKVWIATYKGLIQWNDTLNVRFMNKAGDSGSLPDNSIMALYEDDQEGLWIGTWRGGLAYMNPFFNHFEIYNHSEFFNSVSGNLINVISEDKEGKIWIGTDGRGLDQFDDNQKLFSHYHLKGSESAEANNIKSILCEPDGDIWVGTFRQGIFYKKAGENSFSGRLLETESVYDLVSDQEGLWIASFGNGLCYYRSDNKILTRYTAGEDDPNSLLSNYVRKLLLDKENNLWIISNAGVSIKPAGRENFESLLMDDFIMSDLIQIYTITCDKEGTIWLGTDQGMLSVIRASREVRTHPFLFNGKPVSVYGIVPLDNGQLWISSNCGIFSYVPESGDYLNYSTADGLPGNLFNAGALCHTSTRQIYFGGTTGMVAFNPVNIHINPYLPNVFFSKIYINHKEVLANRKNSPLIKPLYKTETLKLKPSQRSFSLEFVALNYLNTKKNQFKYRLKGFDRDWVESGYNARATYTNIPSGKYVFEVIACNNDKVWNLEPARLSIKIPPVFLLSPVAFVFYILIAALLSLLYRRMVLNRAKLRQQVELERISRQHEEKLHQEKLMFFTNVSHEFRTPLTLITGPLDELLRSPGIDQTKFNQLTLIKRNAGRLLKLINQLLEFRRIENKEMELSVCETDMVPFIRDIFDYFQDIARQKNINYLFVSLSHKQPAIFDPEKIDKVLFNILANAFKYTPEKGTIRVELSTGNKSRDLPVTSDSNLFRDGELTGNSYIGISVEDSGEGIAPYHLPKIFDRFYTGVNTGFTGSGTGIGLNLARNLVLLHGGEIEVESILTKGSVFRFRIPCSKNYLNDLHAKTGISILHSTDLYPGKTDVTDESGLLMDENWHVPEKNHKKETKMILVVEDHRDLRNFIHHILMDEYRVITGSNGTEGIEKARLFLPDLIISDIMMPDKDGLEMVKELKSDISTSHIPIILLTAIASEAYKIESYQLGADDYIEKPFSSDLLKTRMKNLFDNRAALRQLFMGRILEGNEAHIPDFPDQKLLSKAVAFIEKNITDQNLGIEMLAGHLNLSRSTLHRKLKALTNKPASEFIRTIRLEYAARMLKEGYDNIDEVSTIAGFNSHSYFTRSFKEYFGKTPTEFKHSHITMKDR